MNTTMKQILENFNTNGIFPTDEQLSKAIEGNENYYDIYELEMELFDTASNDVNHPYHSMVC
jgi:nucleoside 2-deoxyribosyltransferase